MKKINVLDLFCGAGGLSNGFLQAGYNISCGIDFKYDFVSTFKKNFKNSKAIYEDISKISDREIKKNFNTEKIDVIIGGPPCQGFSNANRWQDDKKDPRNRLFFDFLRFVEILKPEMILIENVRGVLTSSNGFAKKKIQEILNNYGYSVFSKLLNSVDSGVPQKRIRAFFVGFKNKSSNHFDFEFNIPKLEFGIDVEDAIGELYKFEEDGNDLEFRELVIKPKSIYRNYLRSKNNKIFNHNIVYPHILTQEKMIHVPQGGNWRNIPPELFKSNRNNRHSSAYKRLNEKEPSVTIDTGNAHCNYYHPIFNRIPTVREAARIQSFKDDFIFTGSRSSQYIQVGNAVPPLLSKNIATYLKGLLNE